MPRKKLSLSEARRAALAAQGFDRCRPSTRVDRRHIRGVIRQLKLLQLDFVNVLIPAHYLVLFSRLGAYDTERFDRLVYGSREFTEQWAHEASVVPVEYWPLLAHRREDFVPWPNSPIMKVKKRSKYLSHILEIIEERGPTTSAELPPLPGPARRPGDWHRSVPRWALEYHFGYGMLAVANRLPNFQRVYDLPERLIDEPHFGTRYERDEAQRRLLLDAATACGVATMHDLADYFRMSPRDAKPRVDELVAEGKLREVSIDGWPQPAYVTDRLRIPRRIACTSLLSPFDPLVWFRPRAERLFDFHYRIEIYVPANKRKWGYYVLPFLMNERIAARVDLKADRGNRTLLVPAAHAEEDIDVDGTIAALAAELRALADWLGLERVRVSRRGTFARGLAATVRAT